MLNKFKTIKNVELVDKSRRLEKFKSVYRIFFSHQWIDQYIGNKNHLDFNDLRATDGER